MDTETLLLALLEIRERAASDEEAHAAAEELLAAMGEGELREDTQRHPGDRWQGESGRWFTMRADGHVVPAKGDNQGEGGSRGKAQQAEPPTATAAPASLVPPASTSPPVEKTSVGPSKPEERDPEARPPALPEKHKPIAPMKANRAPRNAEGRPTTGYTASGMTNTAFGDMVEAFSSQLGMRSILPEGRRSNKNVKTEGSSIDVEFDHSGWAFEIKAVCVEASEYKAKPKKEEMEGKRRFAEMHNLKPAMMLVVTDVTKGEAHAYWREGIGAYALNPENLTDWNYAGRIVFPVPESHQPKGAERQRQDEAGSPATGTGEPANPPPAGDRSTWQPATSMQDVATRAATLGVQKIGCDGCKSDEDSVEKANAVMSALVEMRDRAPGLAGRVEGEPLKVTYHARKYVGDRAGVVGTYEHGVLQVGANHPATQSVPKYGGWGVDDSVAGYVRHEYAHHVWDNLTIKEQRAWEDLWDKKTFEKKVGKYSGKNAEEGFAEALCAFTHPKYDVGAKLPGPAHAYLAKLCKG